MASGEKLVTVPVNSDVRSIAISGRNLATGAWNGTLTMWQVDLPEGWPGRGGRR